MTARNDESDESRRIARAVLPEGLRRETLAVRTALAPSQHGENSEALFLTSAFVQPDAATMARRFAESEDFTYSRTSNPSISPNSNSNSDSTPSAMSPSTPTAVRWRTQR